MLDFPLQLLIGIVVAPIFWWRGDRSWVAVVTGVLVSLVATVVLSLMFWITNGRSEGNGHARSHGG
jgi:hypothetical protein